MQFKTKPREYQKIILKLALQRKKVLLNMPMGTGKTKVALDWVVNKGLRYVLVICRKDDIFTWQDQAKVHSNLLAQNLMELKKRDKFSHKAVLHLVSYDSMRNAFPWRGKRKKNRPWDPNGLGARIAREPWDAVICDESTKIKHHDAKRTKAIIRAFKDVPNRMIMSGAPITNSLMDIFSQYNFLCSGHCFGDNFWAFRKHYFWQVPGTFDWIPYKWTKASVAAKMAKHAFRCDKEACLPDLPPKVYQKIKVDLLPKQKRIYDRLKEKFELELKSGEVLDINYVIAQFTKLLCITGGFYYNPKTEKAEFIGSSKLRALREWLELEEVQAKKKIVIWAAFNKEIRLISNLLKSLGIKHVRLWGKSPDRIAVRLAFKNKPKIKVLVGQVRMGIGMNELVVADTVVYYSRSLSLEHRLQSEDRTHRIGSEGHRSINYWDIITRHTVDSHVYSLLRKARDVATDIARRLQCFMKKQTGNFL